MNQVKIYFSFVANLCRFILIKKGNKVKKANKESVKVVNFSG